MADADLEKAKTTISYLKRKNLKTIQESFEFVEAMLVIAFKRIEQLQAEIDNLKNEQNKIKRFK